jgi:hypothetical protein
VKPFDAERANRAGDAAREIYAPRRAAAPTTRIYAAPLSDAAIARCRARARAATKEKS